MIKLNMDKMHELKITNREITLLTTVQFNRIVVLIADLNALHEQLENKDEGELSKKRKDKVIREISICETGLRNGLEFIGLIVLPLAFSNVLSVYKECDGLSMTDKTKFLNDEGNRLQKLIIKTLEEEEDDTRQ